MPLMSASDRMTRAGTASLTSEAIQMWADSRATPQVRDSDDEPLFGGRAPSRGTAMPTSGRPQTPVQARRDPQSLADRAQGARSGPVVKQNAPDTKFAASVVYQTSDGKIDGWDVGFSGNESDMRGFAAQLMLHGDMKGARAAAAALARQMDIHHHSPKELAADYALLNKCCGLSAGVSDLPILSWKDGQGLVSLASSKDSMSASGVAKLGIAADSANHLFGALTRRQQNQLVPGVFSVQGRGVPPQRERLKAFDNVVYFLPNSLNPPPNLAGIPVCLEMPHYVALLDEQDLLSGIVAKTATVVKEKTPGAVQIAAKSTASGKVSNVWVVPDMVSRAALRTPAVEALIEVTKELADQGVMSVDIDQLLANAGHMAQHTRQRAIRSRDDGEIIPASGMLSAHH